jgi:hypothetical protein
LEAEFTFHPWSAWKIFALRINFRAKPQFKGRERELPSILLVSREFAYIADGMEKPQVARFDYTSDGEVEARKTNAAEISGYGGNTAVISSRYEDYYSGPYLTMSLGEMDNKPGMAAFGKILFDAMENGKRMRLSVAYVNKIAGGTITREDLGPENENVKWLLLEITPDMLAEWLKTYSLEPYRIESLVKVPDMLAEGLNTGKNK